MSEQKKLIKTNPIVAVLIDLYSFRLFILFPSSGQMASMPFNSWEHVTKRTLKTCKVPHYKIDLLIPEDGTILCHEKGELSKKLNELLYSAEPMPCHGKGWSYPMAHCAPPIGECETGHSCPDCPMKQLVCKKVK